MTNSFSRQISTTRDLMDEAFKNRDIELAKFTLGFIAGAVIAVAPAEDQPSLLNVATLEGRGTDLEYVVKAILWLLDRATDYR